LLEGCDDPQRAAEIVLAGASERNNGALVELLAFRDEPNIISNFNTAPRDKWGSQILPPCLPKDDEESEY
jgi:hypothetical protein